MKNYKNWMGILGAFLVSIMLAGCTNAITFTGEPEVTEPDPVETNKPNPVSSDTLTRQDYLALSRLTTSQTTDVETLEKMVSGLLQSSKGSGSARSAVTSRSTINDVRKVTSIAAKSFSGGGGAARSITSESEEAVELYVFDITDPVENTSGYVLTSNDIRIGNILAIVENGEFDDPDDPFTAILHKQLENYIDRTIAEYAELTDEDVYAALEKLNEQEEGRLFLSHFDDIKSYLENGYVISPSTQHDFAVVKAPLITTNWVQEAPYSNYLNYALYLEGKTSKDFVPGAASVALSQLVTYYGHMNSITPTVAPFNQPTISGWNPNAGVWTGQYNWAAMKNVSTLSATDTAMVGQIGTLIYQIGKNLGVTYDPGKAGGPSFEINLTTQNASSPTLMSTLQAMGYETGDGFKYAMDVETTSSGFSYTNHYISQYTKKSTLDQGHPYLIFGGTTLATGPAGMLWLIDGYGTMTFYTEQLINLSTYEIIPVTLSLSNALMVHCNMGKSSNGWYVDGIFDTGNMLKIPSNPTSSDFSYDFDLYVNWLAPIPTQSGGGGGGGNISFD
jgi:hypothetical protein